VATALADALRARGAEVELLDPAHPTLTSARITGLYWLPALDDEGELAALSADDWRRALELRLKRLYATVRGCDATLGQPGRFLIAATRMGGRHGYDEPGARAPLGGAVTGFTKAWQREHADALVKA